MRGNAIASTAMPRGIELTERDVGALEPLFEQMKAKPGLFERMGKSSRWLILEPVGDSNRSSVELNGVSIELQQTEHVQNLVVHNRAIEPGTEARGKLGQAGVTTPPGWQLAADVGWVLGWRVPTKVDPRKIVEFGFRVVHAVDPVDGMWRARVEPRPPRPGFTEVKE